MLMGKRQPSPKNSRSPRQRAPPRNKFAALEVESQDEGNQEETPENEEESPDPVQQQDNESLVIVSQPQQKQTQEEEAKHHKGTKYMETISEGSVTRSKAKASTEEITETSTEEQEPLSRKGRKSNKAIRE